MTLIDSPDGTESPAGHWDQVYASKRRDEVSWYEREPVTSLRLIERATGGNPESVIDVGGGTSSLVDRLLARSFDDVTVLDISPRALDDTRARLGHRGLGATFIAGDVLTWEPDRCYDVWHDRAVFHFLVEPSDRDRYRSVAARGVRAGGHLILGTFAEDGPIRCSGLPIRRASARELAEHFTDAFTLEVSEREEHVTPTGAIQPFTWVLLQRR